MADTRRPPLCFCDFFDFDAVLHDWILVALPGFDEVYVLMGVVAGDRKGRFADGRGIRTSVVLTPADRIGAGAIVQTQNTRYLLGEERRRN